jgi:glycine/D-amino acid oxidase-like deaminating enzyme
VVAAETAVCVIGAGVMGLSTAWHLARRGLTAIVVDRGSPGREASGATAGTLAIQNKPLEAIPLVIDAIRAWETLSTELEYDIEYERRGGFRLAHSEEEVALLEQAVTEQVARGVHTEVVYQPQLSRAAPYLSPTVQAASYCADDGMSNPLASVRGLLRACRRHGQLLWFNCRIDGIDVRGDREFSVRTDRGDIRCHFVVAAAGAWNLEVADLVGLKLPLTAELLQVSITDTGPPLFPHILTHIRGNLTLKQQRLTGKVMIGGGWLGDGNRLQGIKRVRRESLVGNLARAVEAVPAIGSCRLIRGWTGFEGRTPDRLMLCGNAGYPTGFYLVGCATGGYTLWPIASRMTADDIAFGRPAELNDRYHSSRFMKMQSSSGAGVGKSNAQTAI